MNSNHNQPLFSYFLKAFHLYLSLIFKKVGNYNYKS